MTETRIFSSKKEVLLGCDHRFVIIGERIHAYCEPTPDGGARLGGGRRARGA